MEDRLLHPNLMHTDELRVLIFDSNLNLGNVDNMSRSELLEVFKKFIMPKPQRQKKSCGGKRSNVDEKCNGLVQEVRNIKLNRSISERQSMGTIISEPMDCSPSSYSSTKRSMNESIKDNSVKRQRIQWP